MRSRGFTLIELMVVVVIIGLVSAGFLLSLNSTGRDSQLEQERDRLASLIDYVRERAAIQTVEYGLRCHQDGYQFVMYDSRRSLWSEDPLDDSLRARTLPPGLAIALSVEGRAIVLPQRRKDPKGKDAEIDLTPQLMLFSNGDLTPFKLILERSGAGRSALISSDKQGKVVSDELVEKPT